MSDRPLYRSLPERGLYQALGRVVGSGSVGFDAPASAVQLDTSLAEDSGGIAAGSIGGVGHFGAPLGHPMPGLRKAP